MSGRCLLLNFVCDVEVLERELPVTGKPLEPAKTPSDLSAKHLIPTRHGLCCQGLEDRAGSIELTEADEAPAERDRRAFAVLQHETQPLLDLDAALEQPLSKLTGTALHRCDVPDRHSDQSWVTDQLGLLERPTNVGKRCPNIRLKHANPAPVAENPRQPHVVVGRVLERFVQEVDRYLRVGFERRGQLEEDVGALDAVR